MDPYTKLVVSAIRWSIAQIGERSPGKLAFDANFLVSATCMMFGFAIYIFAALLKPDLITWLLQVWSTHGYLMASLTYLAFWLGTFPSVRHIARAGVGHHPPVSKWFAIGSLVWSTLTMVASVMIVVPFGSAR